MLKRYLVKEDIRLTSLAYFSKKLKIPFNYQVVRQEGIDLIKNGIWVISADKFFASLV